MTNTLHMKHTLLMTTLLSTFSFGVSASELNLKPISNLDNSYKLAKICFLPDCQDDGIMSGDIGIDINKNSKWCENNGFIRNCKPNTSIIETCSRDNQYVKCDAITWCLLPENGYTIKVQDCLYPKVLGTECPNGEKLYKSCYCPAKYKYNSVNCPTPKVLGGEICEGNYETCSCPPKYSFNNSSCTSPNVLSDGPCDGKYGSCTCTPSCPPSYPNTSCDYGYSNKTSNTCGTGTCYSCNPMPSPPVAKACYGNMTFEDFEYNASFMGVITNNLIVRKDVRYIDRSSCVSSCNTSREAGRSWRIPSSRELNKIRCAVKALGTPTYDIYWYDENLSNGVWLFGEDRSAPSWMYNDHLNYCACVSDI